ncbi:hypothetical protein [uncultured Algimonas sp.]|uniref:hypothetical protein n=1 Tax=uncultured Algimonas sp. TaxID=1547920 RepID=UPI00260240F0|nr:hypothetical protein [uncultured Algimonas sp.]
MKRLWLLPALTILIAAGPVENDFDRMAGGLGDGTVIAFVGEEVFTRSAPETPSAAEFDPVTGEESIVISMDTEWESRFRILNLVSGTHDRDTIDFTAFDHYGTPRYSDQNGPVLLFVHDLDSGRYHDKYNFKPVGRTASGGWAICGSPYADDAEKEYFPYNVEGTEAPPRAMPVTFDPPFVVDVDERLTALPIDADETMSVSERKELQAEIDLDNAEIEASFQPPVYERDGRQARCVQGIPVDVAVQHELGTTFRYYEVERHCKAQLAHAKPDGHRGTGVESLEEHKARRKPYEEALKTCFERLYPSGWPFTD